MISPKACNLVVSNEDLRRWKIRERNYGPHSFIARAEAQRWIGIAEKLLIGHDLVGSKTFAIRARDSDPRLEAAEQILAIADTLLAAEKRVAGNNGNQQQDYYAILQLVRFVQDTEHITSQYRRLAVILNPHQNRFRYSDQAFNLVNEAWAVLSNPMRKSMYDSELDFPQQQQMNNLGFNLEQQHHHEHQQHHHQQQHQQHQQQQQHNFFSINHMGSGHEQELPEPPQQTFQTRVQQTHQSQNQSQHQQLQQHNFLSQPIHHREQEQLFQVTSPPHHQTRPSPQPQQRLQSPPPAAAHHRGQEQLFQPQVQPFQVTSPPPQQSRPQPQPPQSPPPAAPPQPPFSWPQAPPPSQPQILHFSPQPQPNQQHEQLQPHQFQQKPQQQEPVKQNVVAPAQIPTQVNNNNGVREEESEPEEDPEEEEPEEETEVETETPNENAATFWTTCPYCFHMYEYPKIYTDCTLRCGNCKRAFQAVSIPSPPPIIEGQEAYFYSWGYFPVGVSMSHIQKNQTNSRWTPFSPFYDASKNVQSHLNECAAPKEKNLFGKKSSGPRIYFDDISDDVFIGVSDTSDDSDSEGGFCIKKKKKFLDPGFKDRIQVLGLRATDPKNGSCKESNRVGS